MEIKKVNAGLYGEIPFALTTGKVKSINGYSPSQETPWYHLYIETEDRFLLKFIGSIPPIIPGDQVTGLSPLFRSKFESKPFSKEEIKVYNINDDYDLKRQRVSPALIKVERDGKKIGLYESSEPNYTQIKNQIGNSLEFILNGQEILLK